MKIKMKATVNGSANPEGSSSMSYKAGVEYDMSQDWQMKLATILLNNGDAEKSVKDTAKKVITKLEKKVENKTKKIVKKLFGKKK